MWLVFFSHPDCTNMMLPSTKHPMICLKKLTNKLLLHEELAGRALNSSLSRLVSHSQLSRRHRNRRSVKAAKANFLQLQSMKSYLQRKERPRTRKRKPSKAKTKNPKKSELGPPIFHLFLKAASRSPARKFKKDVQLCR